MASIIHRSVLLWKASQPLVKVQEFRNTVKDFVLRTIEPPRGKAGTVAAGCGGRMTAGPGVANFKLTTYFAATSPVTDNWAE
jgi:hypothetical protein